MSVVFSLKCQQKGRKFQSLCAQTKIIMFFRLNEGYLEKNNSLRTAHAFRHFSPSEK